MNKLFFVVMCTFSPLVFSGGVISDLDVLEGQEAIGLCLNAYTNLENKYLTDDIDRAYVLISSEKMDVLFARGEVGTFGERSSNYKPFLVCGISKTSDMKINYLGAPLKDPMVDLGVEQITDSPYVSDIWDLLYIRENDLYKFVDSKLFFEKGQKQQRAD